MEACSPFEWTCLQPISYCSPHLTAQNHPPFPTYGTPALAGEAAFLVALFDKAAYGAISAALNRALRLNLHRFNAPGTSQVTATPSKLNEPRAGCRAVTPDSKRGQAGGRAATGNENESVLT